MLGAAALAQAALFLATGSIAQLADLIHKFGDALTAVPVGIADELSGVAVIDAGSFRATATIATGSSPYGIAIVQPRAFGLCRAAC